MTADQPGPQMAQHDEDVHAHRHDMHPALLACDPLWTACPEGNPLYIELCAAYSPDVAFTLWELAAEWHRCELATELRFRTLGNAA